MESPLAINDPDTSTLALNWVLEQGGHAGKVIGSMYGIEQTPDWNDFPSITDIILNSQTLTAVMHHDIGKNTLASYCISNADDIDIDVLKHFVMYNDCELIKSHDINICKLVNAKNELIESVKSYYIDTMSVTPISSQSIYDEFAIFISGVSNVNYRINRAICGEVVGTRYSTANVKSGIYYTNLDDERITVTEKLTTGHSNYNGNITSSIYTQSNHTVNQIVKKVEPVVASYDHVVHIGSGYGDLNSGTATASSTVTYIPL